jgi:hypothetical protein
MRTFQAKIGPPRIISGLAALIYVAISLVYKVLTAKQFVIWAYLDEFFALTFGVITLSQEFIAAFFRGRFIIVEMNDVGLFDRRIMREPLRWEAVEWIEPHPGGFPDRFRVKADVRLTPFGALRNRLLRLIRRIPEGEIVITFGGLNKAASQAAAWLADHQPRLMPEAWKIAPVHHYGAVPVVHSRMCLQAFVYRRAWLSYLLGGVVLLAALAALFPALVIPMLGNIATPPDYELMALIGGMAVLVLIGAGLLIATYLRLSKARDGVIILSQTGLSDVRISSQFIPWNHIDHLTFEWANNGRLVNEGVAIEVQLHEGIQLKPPEGLIFWLPHMLRRFTTPELFILRHSGTTTSVSEIIDCIERHKLPVAIREIARN